MLLIECKKLFKRTEYKLVFLLLCLAVITDFFVLCIDFYGANLSNVYSAYFMTVLYNVSRSPFRLVFVMYLPVCVGLMGGDSYAFDNYNGINTYIITRVNRFRYIWVKALAIFLVAVFALICSMMLSLILSQIAFLEYGYCMHFGQLPDLIVNDSFEKGIFLGKLQYTKPYFGLLIFIVLRGVYGGILALAGYGVSLVFKCNRYIVMAIPFVVFEMLSIGWDFINRNISSLKYQTDITIPLMVYPECSAVSYFIPFLVVVIIDLILIGIGSIKEEAI